MSIAQKEATERYPIQTCQPLDEDPEPNYSEVDVTYQNYETKDKQNAYIAGRIAKPTKSEIDAAAKVLCERWNPGEWDTGFETADDDYRRDAEAMFLAARKAVME